MRNMQNMGSGLNIQHKRRKNSGRTETTETTETTEFAEDKYAFSEITDKIIKCAIEVHKTLGPGFLENVYESALIYEMKEQKLKVENQKVMM